MTKTKPTQKTDPAKQVGIELLLGVAVCAAGYFFVVDPAESRLAKAREQITALAAQTGASARPAIPPERAEALLKEAQERSRSIETRSALAKEQSALFAALMDLSGKHHIRVDQLQPTSGPAGRRPDRRASAPPPPPPPTGPGGAPGAAGDVPRAPTIESACVRYSIAATGSYADLASFIGALQTELGFTRVRSVRIDPVREATTPTVQVMIETEHYAFGIGDLAIAEAPQ